MVFSDEYEAFKICISQKTLFLTKNSFETTKKSRSTAALEGMVVLTLMKRSKMQVYPWLLGNDPKRGQGPVEWGKILFICPSILL